MKKRLLMNFIALHILIFCSCSPFAYKLLPATAQIPADWEGIPLDHSYDFYFRAITSKDSLSAASGKIQKVLGVHTDQLNLNPGVNDTSFQNKRIIGIEYLWVSVSRETVIYVSTVADQYQNRYSDPARFAGLDHPNAADFRVILIGRVDKEKPNQYKFFFKKGVLTDNWTIDQDDEHLSLLRIDEKRNDSYENVYEINDAFGNGMTFYRQKDWEIVFIEKDAQTKAVQQIMDGNKFFYTKDRQKFNIYLTFPENTLLFENKYIIYRPDRQPYKQNVKP